MDRIYSEDENMYSRLMSANANTLYKKYLYILRRFLNCCQNPNTREVYDGKTPIGSAVRALLEGQALYKKRAIEIIIQRGGDPNIPDNNGVTPIDSLQYSHANKEENCDIANLLRSYYAQAGPRELSHELFTHGSYDDLHYLLSCVNLSRAQRAQVLCDMHTLNTYKETLKPVLHDLRGTVTAYIDHLTATSKRDDVQNLAAYTVAFYPFMYKTCSTETAQALAQTDIAAYCMLHRLYHPENTHQVLSDLGKRIHRSYVTPAEMDMAYATYYNAMGIFKDSVTNETYCHYLASSIPFYHQYLQWIAPRVMRYHNGDLVDYNGSAAYMRAQEAGNDQLSRYLRKVQAAHCGITWAQKRTYTGQEAYNVPHEIGEHVTSFIPIEESDIT